MSQMVLWPQTNLWKKLKSVLHNHEKKIFLSNH